MFPKKITEAMKERICKVAEARALLSDMKAEARRLRRVLPSSKQLAHEAGVSVRRVQEIMSNARNQAENVVSRLALPVVEDVMMRHELRMDVSAEPLVRKPFRRRRTPNTAIISDAAKEAIAAREWAETKGDDPE